MAEGAQLDAGFHLLEYEICRTLGAGGFGITYLAKDTHLDRKVAIKEYFPGHIASRASNGDVIHFAEAQSAIDEFEWGRRTFLDEARMLGKFEHPNIIRVSRYFEANNTAYIVMDYAEGTELRDLLKQQGKLTEERTSSIVTSLLDGLEQVHAAGLLHRDIKPGNIIIRQDGSPVLIDFGAARQAIGVKSRSISTIITPGYAPIEQYSSRGNQGPWTDIYALGAVAYACMTLSTPPEATERIRNDSLPSLKQACEQAVSDHFSSVIAWALEPEEQDRPQSGSQWHETMLNGHAVPTKNPSSKPNQDKTEIIPRKQDGKIKRKSGWLLFTVVGGVLLVGGASLLVSNISGIGKLEIASTSVESIQVETARPLPAAQAPANPLPQSKPKPAAKPKPAPPTVSPQEERDYTIATQIGVREAYVLFLRRYPEGRYAEMAKLKIERL